MDKRPGCHLGGVMRNWGLVFTGNFAGALTVAVFMAIIFTFGFTEAPNAVGQKIGHIGEGRTVGYAAHGAAGMLTLFIRARDVQLDGVHRRRGAMMSTSVSARSSPCGCPSWCSSTWASSTASSTCTCSRRA
jgi:hypothetical protein